LQQRLKRLIAKGIRLIQSGDKSKSKRQVSISMNSINLIAPYKHLGFWVFDDERVGLAQEPFVDGADTMIDRVVENIPNAEKGFILVFSASPFPGHRYRLDWLRADEDGGNWYREEELGMEGWLCPALFKYFDEALKRIEKNTYGVCELTAKPIPKARLDAIPWARFTVEAQAQLEREGALRQRRLGTLGSLEGVAAAEVEEEEEAEEKPVKEKE
jgi:hypothetical protein